MIEHRIASDKLYSWSRCFETAFTSTDSQGFTGNHSGYRVTLMHGKCIHHPRHNLWIGIHVRCRNIAVWTYQNRYFCSIATAKALKLRARQRMGITENSPFGPTKRDTDNGAFPRHPHGQRAHLIERDFGAKTDTTLGRSAIDVVLHPVTCEHL